MKKTLLILCLSVFFLVACSKTQQFELDYSKAVSVEISQYNEDKEKVSVSLSEAETKELIAFLNGKFQGTDTNLDYVGDEQAYYLKFFDGEGVSYNDVIVYQEEGQYRILAPYSYDIILLNDSLVKKVQAYFE